MEGKKEKIFPWMKDVLQSFATSFMVDYDSNVLCILHRNIDKEINMIYSSNDRTIERTEALYKEITYIYEHMRLKISQHPEFQNATLSCVKLMSQLIRVGLILTQGLINSEWIERILTALELFPGEKVLVYDALFLVNGLKKVHQKPYCAILRRIMTEDHHEFVTDPLVYMEIILLFRRLKALVLNRYKEKYNILVTKIKPPSNLISWLASLDVNGYSPYLKNLKYKKIAQQLMKKALPESFIKKIRYMALNQYNFEIDDSELKIPETKNHSSSVFIIDNTSSTKCDNLDMLENSHKAITKKMTNSQARRKRKPLLLNENIENDENSQLNSENKSSNICINESGIDNNNHKHFSKSNKTVVSKKKQKSNLSNSNKRIIVSKKKKKSKSNLVKSSKSETSTNLNKDVSDNDLFFQDVEGSTLLHDIDGSTLFQVNKSTLSKEDPDSGSENEASILCIDESDKNIASNKHSPNSAKNLTVPKKKRKLKSKNTKSYASATVNKDVSNSDLFFRDGENNNIPEQSNKSNLNDKDSESSSEIKVSHIHINNSDTDQTTHKHFPSSTEHIIVSKEKKKSKRNLIKNINSEPSAIHSEDVPDSALFFHDVKGSSNSKKLKTTYNISNRSISSKRDLSEDTDTLDKNVSKNKNCKKLKSSKDGERTISDSSLSNNKLDSNIVSHQQLMSENKNNKLENSFKDDESIVFETEVSGKKRKNITSIDDSASDDKCIYFKKLMLQKVSNQSKNTSTEISNEHKNVNSAVTETDYSKMPDIKENSKNVFVNVTENITCENQSVQSENVRVKNLEENVIINESSSITESENETVPLKSVVNESFEEEKNAISNIPSDQSDNFNDSIHPKNIDNLSTEKENILIVQSFEKTKLLIEPKIADESSTLGTKIQTTEESNNSTINNLNSEWIEEDNLVKNKEFNVILLKSDTSIATVSNVECKDTENKQNMKESIETFKSNQIANEKSRPSTELPCTTDVSENIPEPSQNVDVKNNKKSIPEKDMHSNFIITDYADLPIMAKGIPNKTQQMSDRDDPDKHACIAEYNTSIDSSSCENSIITQHNENFSTFPVEKTLHSTILDESSCKANFESVEFEAMQKALHQSEDKEICHHVEDNAEHSIISVVKKQEEKSEEKDAQALDKLNDEKISSMLVKERHVHEKSVLDSQSEIISNQRIVSNENILISNKLVSLDTVNNSDNDLKISVKGKEYTLQVVESEKVPDVSENSEKKYVLSSQIYIVKTNENSKENLSTEITLSSNESACSDNICSSENKAEISIKEEPQSLLESTTVVSDKLKVVYSQDDITISNKNNEKELLNENIPSSNDCSNKISNSSDNIKTSIEIMDSTIHSLPLIKKSVDACRNSDMFSTINSQDDSILGNENCERNSFCENIPSLKESTSFNNIRNPENDVKIVESTVHLLPVIKKPNDVCENSDQLNSIDSQNISLKGPTSSDNLDNDANNVQVVKSTVIEKPVDACENSDELNSISSKNFSLKESTSSDNLNNPENDAKIVENTVHLLPVMEKSVDACINSDELNSINSKDVSLKESISSDNLNNSENVKIVESTVHLLPVIEKPVDTCENSGELNSINSKDVSLKDSTNSDDLYNPENDVKMMKNAIHLLPVIEKHIDAFENAGHLKAVNSQNDTIIGNENNLLNENVPSSKECSDNICNSANDFKVPGEITENNIHSVPVIENKIVPCENSDELKAVNYQDGNVTISNKKDLLNESSSFSKECSDNVNNLANGIKVSCEIMKNAIHSPPVIEKSIVACENSDMLKVVNSQDDNEKDLSNKNHSSQKESTSFDNIHNSENDVKISDEHINNTVPSSPLNEQLVDTCENSHQLSVINSQNDCIRDDENKETDLSSEKNVTSSVKEKEDSLQLLECKNVEETPLNIKNTSSKKMDVEVKTSSLCAKSNLNERVTSCERMSKDNEREKSCERMSKDSESDADCNSDFQERYIVLDESYSDVDDCKSNYSEQSNENRSPKKKTVTATNKSKFKPSSSSDPSSRYLPENYNQQIVNISEVSLQKSTNEMASIILPIKSDATDKSEIKSDISSSNDKSNYLHKKDTSEVSHRNCANDIDNTTLPVNTVAACESKLKGGLSSIDDCHKHLCVEDDPQIKPIFKKDTNKMDSTILPIKNYATNKSEIKSNISSSNDKSNNLHEKDTIEESCRSYSNDIDNTTLPLNAVAASESKFEAGLSSTNDCHKHSCVKDDLQTKQTFKKSTSKVSQENCASEIDGTNSHESNLSDIKKDLEHSLEDSNSKEKLISVMHNQCSSVLQTESPKKEIKFAEIGEQIIKRMKRKSIEYPSEVSESLSVTSFCNDKNRESFTEISVKNKDKSLDTKSVGSVPTNRFPYDPSTEFFSVYKNKLVNDKDNKTKASLSSRGQTFTEIPFKDKDKNIDIESEGCVPISNFSSISSIELCKNKLTNEEDNKTKASLTSSNQCFREIPFKDKDLDIETAGSVPINNFSSSVIASTESFDMYRNELTNDEDNKTEASLSSRDDILSNYQENDEIKSQTFSSDHSDDDDDDFRSSSQEEEKDNCADDTIIPSEDCNDQSKTIDESFSLKNVPSTAETENDSLDTKNWAKDKSLSGLNVSEDSSTHEKNSVTSVLPRQSLRLKTKTELKCQTNSGEFSTSDTSKIQEISKKELKLVLVDCKSSLETENNTNNLSIENTFSCPLTHDNNEDIASSQTSVIKKSISTAKDKSKESSTDCNKSAKRYSLRHRKSNQSRDDSANLGIDLNKLKFDSPKCTRSTRGSKYVKFLTSPPDDTKLQDNPSDVKPTKRETRSSAKSDVGIEPNTPSYNLRNRKAIIAPARLNV